MAKRKTQAKRRTASSVKVRGRKTSRTPSETITAGFGRFGLPLLLSLALLAAIGVFAFMFYSSATNSSFFRVRNIEVRGNDRTQADDIRRVVAGETEKAGVWNADLADLRIKLEKFPFVKTASVSRMLPAGLRVDIVERVPAAIVHMRSGDFLVDGEGTVLASANGDKTFPFVLYGWDEAKTEKAPADNTARLKLYKKMLDEWKSFDLAARVKQVDLSDIREPEAVIQDSGRDISIVLAKDSLGKSLKTAIEAVSGKGAKVKSVNADGVAPVINYLDF
jgi:cell division septal protein FtsQ